MITKMKKFTFLVYHREYDAFLTGIRALGAVHVAAKQQGTPDSPEIQAALRLSARLTAALKGLESLKAEPRPADASTTATRGLHVADEAEALQSEKSKLNGQLQACLKDEKALEPWGDFDPNSLRRLREAGLDAGFYTCSESGFQPEWETTHNALIINRLSSKVYFLTLTPSGQPFDLNAEHVKLPACSLSQVREQADNLRKALQETDAQLTELAARDIPSLKAALNELHNETEFSTVKLNTQTAAEDKLMLLQGWAPAAREPEIRHYAETQNAYCASADPAPEDQVPIQLSNKGLFAWFEPICKLYMLPKYNELDLTPFFAPFFMLFFGLCLGDSGYGLFIFLGVTGYRILKSKHIGPTLKPVLSLVQVLMASTFFCGLLTGTFFGFNLYELDLPWIQRLKDAISMNNNDLFQLSLILGVVQILFGMILKAVNQVIQFGFKYAVGTGGWILLLLSTGAAVVMPGVIPLGGTVYMAILCIAALMIFGYNSPDKNTFVNIGLGFWDSYNMATGLLGDVLSYVRLFALGLSGGILAGVFNSLAKGMSPDNVVLGPIVMLLIFVIGHSINMFMNVLGAMVHPMRLTFVEFFKNAGYEGGGKEYKPFAKN